MSFNDEESFKETVESLRFNSSMPLQDSERNDSEDIIILSDPITTLRRVGSSSSLSVQETRRSEDIPVSFDNPTGKQSRT